MNNPLASLVVLIPARGGSKGIANKNLRLVGGMSLAGRALHFARSAFPGSSIVLSSDSSRVFSRALAENLIRGRFSFEHGNGVVHAQENIFLHRRGPEYSADAAPLGPLVGSVWDSMGSKMTEMTALLILQPTSPFRSNHDGRIVTGLIANLGPRESAVSVVQVEDAHPARMYTSDDSGTRLQRIVGFDSHEFTPRQMLKSVYLRDGAFYLLGSEVAASGRQLGEEPQFFERKHPWTLNIDSWRDLHSARQIARNLFDD